MSYSEISEIASEWWAKNIMKPKFDNGDDSPNGVLANILMHSLVQDITEEQINKFKFRLKAYIENELNEKTYNIWIGVDYHPCKILCDISKECNINVNNLPIKSDMDLDRTHITARLGYGGEMEILYSTKEYWERQLKGLKINLENYKNKEKYDWLNDSEREEGIINTLKEIKECENKINSYKN